jgi:prepilin-type N-terminal cleavage/methylation domain-containing protein
VPTRRKAFTLLELLVAIAIIALLAGLLIFGGRTLFSSQQERQTRVIMQSLDSMIAEAEKKVKQLPEIFDLPTQALLLAPYNTALFNAPPGQVSEGGDDRENSIQVRYAGAILAALSRVPENKAALERFPPDRRLNTHVRGSTPPPYESFVLIDGWGNPIIFVPPTGLRNVTIGGVSDCTVRSDLIVRPGNPAPANPRGRGFWASAGPDGSFVKGDDNVYSFEN